MGESPNALFKAAGAIFKTFTAGLDIYLLAVYGKRREKWGRRRCVYVLDLAKSCEFLPRLERKGTTARDGVLFGGICSSRKTVYVDRHS